MIEVDFEHAKTDDVIWHQRLVHGNTRWNGHQLSTLPTIASCTAGKPAESFAFGSPICAVTKKTPQGFLTPRFPYTKVTHGHYAGGYQTRNLEGDARVVRFTNSPPVAGNETT